MRCAFCFATFQDVKQSVLPKGHLPKEQAIALVQQLADFGFQKITFAGGEPTLCPWLPELIATAKTAGLTTMIVSNGSQLTDDFLEANRHHLDWIALSIDSLNPATNLAMGRAITGKKPLSAEYYHSLVEKVKQYGYGLKINTVVTRLNLHENISGFIRLAQPKRWKILQVLPIAGQNDGKVEALEITEDEFVSFISRHQSVANCTSIIPETNAQVKGSYAMIDPAGRFFQNTTGTYLYSLPIIEIGVFKALQSTDYSFAKFISRGGIYDWSK
jgi:radical S-adenosyl methionine domain-containing protein 2